MNRFLFTISLTLILSLGFTVIANAEPASFWFSGGSKDGICNFAVGFGIDNIGIEFGVIDDANLPVGTLDYECPHWDFTSLGNRTLKPSAGIDLIGSVNLSENIILYGGPGLYWHQTGEIVRSNATDWLYTQSYAYSAEIVCSGGFKFALTDGSRLGIGYHSLRGANLIFGFNF